MRDDKLIQQYFERYSEISLPQLNDWPHTYEWALVIPVWRETSEFLQRLQRGLLSQHSVLLIVVINRPDDTPACPANRTLIEHIRSSFPCIWQHPALSAELFALQQSGILLLDRESSGVPAREGVGAARKLGCDFAAALHCRKAVANPWLHTTDADAVLPDNYLTATQPLDKRYTAACYQFRHSDQHDDISRATQLYQRHMEHYREGLESAGSPYAFHTIGSTLAFHCKPYLQARGFPRKAAGEDFYLLNKMAKLGSIATLTPCITLQSRASDRVPFGTGPSCQNFLEQLRQGISPTTYHPDIFVQLKHWLHDANSMLQANDVEVWNRVLEQQPSAMKAILSELGIAKLFKHLTQSEDVDWKRRHFHDWFDGFRTLRVVLHLHREAFTPVAIESLPNARKQEVD